MTATRRKPALVTPRATLRVAIYARQSVEDRDSEFGSIEAQCQAVAAYVASQTSLGWTALPDPYVDAGRSGKNLDRPAFQKLLADIEAGNVDIVAVYKLDRLSRSLADVVGLITRFQACSVEFVSITQNFSTTTSTGRLTLNLLASFAEFEREQISERTRDKMLAARKRGMWTGGPVPLGYDVVEKKLVVNEPEAEQVRWLFAAYLDLGSVTRTIDAANARGVTTKSWTAKDGKAVQGTRFSKNTLCNLLTNPIYVGDHKAGAEVVQGQHEAILGRPQWDAVAALIRSNHNDGGAKVRNRYGAMLRGLVTCAVCGSKFTHTLGGSIRYYACARLLKESATACPGSRVPVALLEPAVVERLRAVGRDPRLVEATIVATRAAHAAHAPALEADAKRIERQVAQKQRERTNLVRLVAAGGALTLANDVARVEADVAALKVRAQAVRDELTALRVRQVDESELRRVLSDFDPIWGAMRVHEREAVLRILVRELTFDGRTGEVALNGTRFTLPIRKARQQPPRRPHKSPRRGIRGARLLALAQVVEARIERGEIRDLTHAAELFGVSRARMTQVAQLADLAPDLQERLLAGDTSIPERALRAALRSADWNQQRAAIEDMT